MTASTANLMNAVCLIAMSLWGYFGSETPSPTAFIPAGFGVLFLALNNGLKNENKIISHVVVLLTALLIAMLASKPLMRALNTEDTLATVRIGLMIATSFLAMIAFIRSFMAARRAR